VADLRQAGPEAIYHVSDTGDVSIHLKTGNKKPVTVSPVILEITDSGGI
jgi:hypothetical protein